ncbi:HAD family hydrolase [Gorillibacterium massiliense]|uniref:HAD family hydrolase n=1 Tax=Gorillibacterium massiliense TaxID=1280390 RepID=UPI0004B7ADED|nr:HAD family hydrolase [Gorillibacterium massiliense]
MIKAVIFDFDGLILDTETHEFETYKELFREHGAELTLDVWGSCVGTASGFNPYHYLNECVGRELDPDEVRNWRLKRYEARMQEEPLRPGVENYLQTAGRLGLKIGLASSSSADWVLGYLRHYGIENYFACISTRDMVEEVKPNPELYLRTLRCLGVEAHEAVAFEDSPNGALAAERAGMHCVAVPNAVTETLPFGAITLRISSMADLPLEELLAKLNESAKREANIEV